MRSCTEVVLEAGETLYRQGDPNDCGYVIETGQVVLLKKDSGKSAFVERRGAGSILGELSILTGQPRTVTVVATQRCRMFKIPSHRIVERFERLDPVLRACIETSISFSAALKDRASCGKDTTPLALNTLRNPQQVIERLRIEADLRDALVKKEFEMLFQPILRLADQRIVGAEALIRWNHAHLGPVSPDEFIPLAEDMDAIGELTEFAVERSCRFLGELSQQVMPDAFFLSVNVSGKDVVQDKFLDFVEFSLDRFELPAHLLKFEVTETALISEMERAAANLVRLRHLGCGLALDDFGSGYANFLHLRNLPFTTLKIDKGSITGLGKDEKAQNIVRVLLDLGKALEVDVVAEGLETRDDAEILQRLGCPMGQGFYFHKPMRSEDLVAELVRQNRRARDSA